MSSAAPYLSIVATTRNDDHGGSLLQRTQTFVNALIGQVQKHGLSVELILVEWNPPSDRPRLRDALRWPPDLGPIRVRFIEAPPHVHARYRHAEALPLYQMIAKNAGIRRARGEFVLATNIDILFSDELASWLADERLERGCMYRIDRHDVDAGVPVDASVEERLAYCRSHVIRVNSREGTFPTTAEGARTLAAIDIADPASGISLLEGWLPPQLDGRGPFRWVEEGARVAVCSPANRPPVLELEIEPAGGALEFSLVDGNGAAMSSTRIGARSRVTMNLQPGGGPQSFQLCASPPGSPVSESRIVVGRVFRCRWAEGRAPGDEGPADANVAPAGAPEHRAPSGFFQKALGVCRRAAENGPVIQVWVPVPEFVRRTLRWLLGVHEEAAAKAAEIADSAPAAPPPPTTGPRPIFLHTNACGDFTLMAKEHWFELRGYPEWDLYSFHLDSMLCHAAHYGGARQRVLAEPLRIYHIEHGRGSGWTPEGEDQLFERLRRKRIPWLEYQELVCLAEHMRKLDYPLISNRETWGLADIDLPESALPQM